jgi:hypothetical protein
MNETLDEKQEEQHVHIVESMEMCILCTYCVHYTCIYVYVYVYISVCTSVGRLSVIPHYCVKLGKCITLDCHFFGIFIVLCKCFWWGKCK